MRKSVFLNAFPIPFCVLPQPASHAPQIKPENWSWVEGFRNSGKKRKEVKKWRRAHFRQLTAANGSVTTHPTHWLTVFSVLGSLLVVGIYFSKEASYLEGRERDAGNCSSGFTLTRGWTFVGHLHSRSWKITSSYGLSSRNVCVFFLLGNSFCCYKMTPKIMTSFFVLREGFVHPQIMFFPPNKLCPWVDEIYFGLFCAS